MEGSAVTITTTTGKWLRIAVTFIIGMSIGILTGFVVPFYYWLIGAGLVAGFIIFDYLRSPLGKVLRVILIHTLTVIAGVLFASFIWEMRIFETATAMIMVIQMVRIKTEVRWPKAFPTRR